MTSSDRALVAVWLLLLGATLLSFAIFDLGPWDRRIAAVVVIGVAATKIHFILWYFMELKEGPRAWKLAFRAWTILCAIMISGLYLVAP
ncbi:hypothetical protein BH10PSE12_BH10PSE12_12680 [soil metagenome]